MWDSGFGPVSGNRLLGPYPVCGRAAAWLRFYFCLPKTSRNATLRSPSARGTVTCEARAVHDGERFGFQVGERPRAGAFGRPLP
jgi:hypothetical protein